MVRFFTTVLKIIMITIGSMDLYAVPPVIGKPWHQSTREHLFGFVDGSGNAYCSIEDEGFRWRNSFNFTVNGNSINPNNWFFNKVVHFVSEQNVFSDADAKGAKIDYTNNTSSNDIHTHLAEIALNVKNLNAATVAAVAAITIVIEHEGQFYAFSKVLSSERRAFVSLNSDAKNRFKNLLYIFNTANEIRDNLLKKINLNIPFPGEIISGLKQYIGYSCSEGKILSLLVEKNFSLFKSQINNLLIQARTRLNDKTLNCNSIHNIILHINVTMDPCAICTRCMVGLSKYLNEGKNIRVLTPTEIDGVLGANFFIEVSSNGRYPGANADAIGSFTGYFRKIRSSHAECGGHDGREGNIVNLQPKGNALFPAVDNSSLVLPGGMKSWRFNPTFPPYVVFGQVNAKHDAPDACREHRGHNLPPVQ